MIKIICQINQEILKALKNNGNISKAFQLNVPIVGEDLLRCSCFIYSFVIQVISEKVLCIKDLRFEIIYMKIIVTMSPTDLNTNSLLSSLCPFIQTKYKNQVFSKLVV